MFTRKFGETVDEVTDPLTSAPCVSRTLSREGPQAVHVRSPVPGFMDESKEESARHGPGEMSRAHNNSAASGALEGITFWFLLEQRVYLRCRLCGASLSGS